jgi:hypothetical protein
MRGRPSHCPRCREQRDFVTFPESPDNELRHFHDSVGMVARELLLDGRAVVER